MTEREIDALVAEKVMGWTNVHCKSGGNVPYGQPDDDWNRDAKRNRGSGEPYLGEPLEPHELEVPEFSSHIADAWQVVERMREEIFSTRTRFIEAIVNEISARLLPDKTERIHYSAILLHVQPIDICKAALVAKRIPGMSGNR